MSWISNVQLSELADGQVAVLMGGRKRVAYKMVLVPAWWAGPGTYASLGAGVAKSPRNAGPVGRAEVREGQDRLRGV